LIFLACTILVILCTYQISNWLGERAWEKHLQSLHSEHLALRPKIADDQNFAKTRLLEQKGYKDRNLGPPVTGLAAAHQLINFNAMADFRQGTFTHLAGYASTNFIVAASDKEAAQTLLNEMAKDERPISELLEASKRPYSRFDMEIGVDGPIPNFVLLRTIAQVFHYRALCFLTLNNPDGAAAQMCVLDQVVEGLRQSPYLVSSMIRNAVIGLEPHIFYEGWARRQWTAHQYSQFQKSFGAAACLEDFHFSIMSGETFGVAEFITKKSPRELVDKVNFGGVEEAKEPVRALLVNTYFRSMPKGWWLKNLVEHHRILNGMRTNLYDPDKRLIFAQNDQRTMKWFDKELSRARPFHYVAAAAIPNFAKALRAVAKNQATCDQAGLVCALERYALQNRSYPDSLTDLVPEFLAGLPKDIITGKPPIYQKKQDGTFLLYSTGWDGTDNSAPPGTNDYYVTGQDFVWPFISLKN
jgi:hypothetical protein